MAFNREYNNGCPCMGCTDRHQGCHGKCDKYKEWRAKMDKLMKARQDARVDTMSEARAKKIWREKRRKAK